MGDVISIKQGKKPSINLNDFLREAHSYNSLANLEDGINVLSSDEFAELFRHKAFQLVAQRNMINTDIFICIGYIANILKEMIPQAKRSWIISDYLIKDQNSNTPKHLKEAANTCFFICAVFPDRANWRLMNKDFYEQSGSMFYYTYYTRTQKPFAYYMNRHFREVVALTASTISSLKQTQ